MRASSSSPAPDPALHSLIAALERGTTVVTANNRIAGWIRQSFDLSQQQRGFTAWTTPQVLPWTAWLRTLWQRLRASSGVAGEQLLTPWQEQRIWTGVIGTQSPEASIHASNAVQLAMRAWETAQAWNGPWAQWGGENAREEQRTFVGWAEAFTRRCADNNWIDAPRLPLLIIDALRERRLVVDESIGLYGFAELAPRQQQLVDALAQSGTRISVHQPGQGNARANSATRIRCSDPAEEYRRCAQWCRELLARNPAERIGVVIPDLAQKKREVERVFAEMLGPRALLEGARPQASFNISHGDPLSSQPIVDAALTLLRWTQSPIDLAQLSALARSPYVAAPAQESSARATLLRDAIGQPHTRWPLAAFVRFAARYAPGWSDRLRALAAIGATWNRHRSAKEWRRTWEEALSAAGWLTGNTLDSVEFQSRSAWNEMLDAWMRAENIAGPTGIDHALSGLRELAESTIFQPESGDAPVHILGFLEAAGLRFESLWVCGLTAERWPPAPAPNALLPLSWQRSAAAPHASAERELRFHRELTAQFATAADSVIFSWPAAIDDIPQTPSSLLEEFSSESAPDLLDDRQPGLAALIRHAGKLEAIDDRLGLAFAAGEAATGSAGLIEAQAHCRFHGYARFRLKTEPWPAQSTGLDPLERGILVHCMLAEFWNVTPDSSALAALSTEERSLRIEQSVAIAMKKSIEAPRWDQLGTTMRDLERARLCELLDEWLEVEAARPPFKVEGAESKRQLPLGALTLRLRIDRIDSTGDAAGDDGWIVTDYKTGKSTINALQVDDRLTSPQLPLYAEAVAPAGIVGVAYGSVRRGECAIAGIGAPSDWPALKPANPDWPTRRARWHDMLTALADSYLAGDATVDPWKPLSCDRCHRQALCRINERIGFVTNGEGGGE